MMEGKDLLKAIGGIDESSIAKNSQVYKKREHHYIGFGIAAGLMLGVIAIAAVVNANKVEKTVKEEIHTEIYATNVLENQTENQTVINVMDNAETERAEESKLAVREVEILGESVGVIEDVMYELKVKRTGDGFNPSQISNVDRNHALQTALESFYLEGSDGKIYDSDDLKYVVSISLSPNVTIDRKDYIDEFGVLDELKLFKAMDALYSAKLPQEEEILNEFERLKETNEGLFFLEPAGMYYNDDYSSCKFISMSKILALLPKKTIANLVTNQDYRYSLRLESYKDYEDLMAMNYKADYTAEEKAEITRKVTKNNNGN